MMETNLFKTIVSEQRAFFLSGKTLPLTFRIHQLKKLKNLIQTHEELIIKALFADLGKSLKEASFDEIALTLNEIDVTIKYLSTWAQPNKVKTPLILQPARSLIYYEPYGCVLILAPWNYPFFLIASPLIGAMAAGNCVCIKPSEVAANTQNVIAKLINENFPHDYLKVITGGPEIAEQVLQEKFDYLFFTGGPGIGKKVMQAAAQHLTPVTLELGGKSPCIVEASADLDHAARRIAWAKTMNAGQVCIAPDYLYIARECKETFIKKFIAALGQFYGRKPAESKDYSRIINQKHFARLKALIEKSHVIYGGEVDEAHRYIAPTLIDDVSWNDPIMQEEIFGPLLPLICFDRIETVMEAIQAREKPLALYLFTKNKTIETQILQRVSFGSGCVNDCILQIANVFLPFGGIGHSGMGQYHGQYSFETFSHRKSIYVKRFSFELNIEYPPYTQSKIKWLKRLLRF